MTDEAKIELLKQLVSTETINNHEATIATYLKELFETYGIDAELREVAPGRANLIAEIGNPEATNVLLFSGHEDTVAIGHRESWHEAPLEATIEDGQLYGRGSTDMKSGLAAMVITLIELHERGLPKTGKIRFLATIGEEYGAMGARELTKQGIVADVSAMIIGEPTGGNVVYAHNGSLNYSIESTGKAAHSSMPEKGVNALTNLVKFINREANAFDDVPDSPSVGHLVHSVTVMNAGDQVNSIPAKASLAGNIRPIPEFNNEQVIARLNQLVDELNQAPDVQLKLTIIHSFLPLVNDPQTSFISLVKKVSDQVFGHPMALQVIHGATDASEFEKQPHHFPIAIIGAGDWTEAHAVDEHVSLDNFLKINQVYEQLALQFFNEA